MAKMQTATISFHEVTNKYPTRAEIKDGVYAVHRMSGDLIKISRDITAISPYTYSLYAAVKAFPRASQYDSKYDDLVKAKDILKDNKWTGDGDEIGRAIYYIKRFLEKNAKP